MRLEQTLKRRTRDIMIPLICAAIVWSVSFLWERRVFQIQYRHIHIGDYILCRILEYCFIYMVFRWLYNLFVKRQELEIAIIKYGLPYYFLLVIVHKLIGTFPFQGDELNIYNAAIKYDASRGFSYFTGYFYMICLMVIPCMAGIIQIKMLLQALTLGYVVFRLKRIYDSKWCYVVYLVACLPWVLALGINVHRMPTYAVLYILLISKLYCDYKENHGFTWSDIVGVSIMLSVLTWWRAEGIYMFILGLFLICIAYRLNGKTRIKVCCMLMMIQIFIAAIQVMPTQLSNASYIEHRMEPFYAYTVTIMCREGLDWTRYPEEKRQIDDYISIDQIEWLNNELQEKTYDDVYILFPDDYPSKENSYRGVRQGASEEDYNEFVKAVQKIIIKNPVTFAKAKIHAWNWISFSWLYKIGYQNLNIKGALMKVIEGVTGNLYIPLVMLVIVCIWAIKRRQWLHLLIAFCGLSHGGLSFLLMPAAYFKYFYIMYLLGIIYLTGSIVWWFNKKGWFSNER